MRRSVALAAIALCIPWAALADEPDAKESPLGVAQSHLQKGRYEEALETLDSLDKDADPSAAAILRSEAHEALGEWDNAAAALAPLLKGKPSAAVLARQAELQFRRGNYTEAEQSAARALQLEPNNLRARLVQADVFTETGRLKEAGDAYRWFVRHYNQAQPTDAEALWSIGLGSAQYARWNSVSSVFNFIVNTLAPDMLADDKESWRAHYLSGLLLLEKYNREQAIPDFQKALAINPRAADVLVALGEAELQQHDLEAAEKFADQALAVNPKHVAALQLKADVRIQAGRLDEARELLKTALEVNPHEQRTLARVAACDLLEDDLPLGDRYERLLSNLDAPAEAKIDQPTRFEQLVLDLAKRNPRPGYFLATLGQTLDSRRQYDAAERTYKQAIAVMPQLAEPKTGLGLLYMRVGKTEQATQLLDDAFKADPYHVRVSNMRKVLKLLEGYETITTDHFVIRVDSEADRILGQAMAEYLEEIYPELVAQFGYEPPHRTHFEIYNKAKGLSAHQWFSARMVGLPWIQTIGASTGVIVALASPNGVGEPFNWARVLRHEFVHVLTLQQTGFHIPHWFTEALAVTSEGYPRPEKWNRLLLERVPKGELGSLDELNDGFIRPETPDDWTYAYCQSRLYAQYMIEKYGPETIPKMLDAYRRKRATKEAIPEAFGVDVATFEKGYREFVNAIVAGLKSTEGPAEERTAAELEKAHEADPDDPQTAAAYAFVLYEEGKRTEARELAEKAIAKKPGEPKAALVIAALELRAGDADAAIAALKAGLNREQPHKQVLASLAKLQLQQEAYDEAATLYELGREKFPDDTDMAKGLAAAYLKLDETAKLKAVLLDLSQRDADDAVVRKKLAQLALDAGEYAEAKTFARLALHINVLDADVHAILAEAAHKLGDDAGAQRAAETALEIDAEHEKAKALLETLAK